MDLKIKDIPPNLSMGGHSIPSNTVNKNQGKKMIKRYINIVKYCKDKIVLDSCCGFAWGSYILSETAKIVYCLDIDTEVIKFSKKFWNDNKMKFINKNALNFNINNKFDVISCMESIEHFCKGDGELYIKNMHNSLKKDGILIGSSLFLSNRKGADRACLKNKYHKYIYTYTEIKYLLNKFFKNVKVSSTIFICKEKK